MNLPNQLPPLDVDPTAYREQRHAAVYSRARRVVQEFFNLLTGPVLVGGLGGDVSKWQASVDWQKAKANGWSFVFIRVLYGMAVDSKFTAHWINSKVAGLKRGAYAYYLDAEDPEDQAQKLFDTLTATGNLGDLPVVADIEEYGNVEITPAKVKKYLEKLTELFGAGNVIVYTGKSVWDTWIGDVEWAKAYPLWLAQYTLVGWQENHLEKVKNYPPTPPKPWVMWDGNPDAPLAGRVAVWQFTASCPAGNYGVSGTVVDLDYASPQFAKKYLNGGPIVPPPIPGGDVTQAIKCVTLGSFINLRANHDANAVDAGNFNKNEEAVCFPDKTFVKKADLPNKEIWRLVLKADETVGWAAEWHPTIKNAAGQQYAAIVDLAFPTSKLRISTPLRGAFSLFGRRKRGENS